MNAGTAITRRNTNAIAVKVLLHAIRYFLGEKRATVIFVSFVTKPEKTSIYLISIAGHCRGEHVEQIFEEVKCGRLSPDSTLIIADSVLLLTKSWCYAEVIPHVID